ncbi:hypothetical protein [Nocardia aurantiaca]|uniref:Uncharacterized protein n=1 Tax=Nocardia aurantiaca TaxID=2675850 RepID=A0A6I3L0H2_9NOCA|nr:hypothetical protein [Nocardia aurantiaca]MTE15251.1 hypothetical protein [Nocardia aurantiaca]
MSGGPVPRSSDRTPMVEALSEWRLRELLAEVQDRLVQVQAGGDDEHGVDQPVHAVVHIHDLRAPLP